MGDDNISEAEKSYRS